MRASTLAVFGCLFAIVASQGIVYNGKFCTNFGIGTATNEWKNKYKTMITNLNKDSTLKAQKTRAANFLNKNWKNLKEIFDKEQLALLLAGANSMLEARWRIVTNFKGLLAKIKPKLGAAKFTEIKNMLWAMDKADGNNVYYAYDDWKRDMIEKIPAAKKTDINKIIGNYEKTNPLTEDDKWSWMPGLGFNKCNLA